MDRQKIQGLLISMKSLFLIYIAYSFFVAYENIVFIDARWGQIFTTAILFAIPYLILDYIIALLRYFSVIRDDKLGGIFILDLMIDHAPKFWTKKGFIVDWKGFVLQIVLGLAIFSYFWGQTTVTGEIFSGVPSVLVPAQLSPVDAADKAGLVAPPEDTLATTITSLAAILIAFVLGRFRIKGMTVLIIALLAGSYISSLFMADLHTGVYRYNEAAKTSIQKFFLVGNLVSSATGAQYSFDIYHFLWNRELIRSGKCIGC